MAGERATHIEPQNNWTGFMISFAVRYCINRHSTAPGICADWLKEHWHLLGARTQADIVREISLHIRQESERSESTAVEWECDLRTWQEFIAWEAQQPSITPAPSQTRGEGQR